MASPNPWLYEKVIFPQLESEGIMGLTFFVDGHTWDLGVGRASIQRLTAFTSCGPGQVNSL